MKTNQRVLVAIAIAVLIAVALITYIALSDRSPTMDTLIIGAVLPLTAAPPTDLSSYGVDTRKALELALEQQKAKGDIAGGTLELKIEDSQGHAAKAVSAFTKLVDIDGAVACLGPITSPEVLSLAPIANQKRVPIVSPSSTSVDITEPVSLYFARSTWIPSKPKCSHPTFEMSLA